MPSIDATTSVAATILHWLLITSASATLIACAVVILQTLFGRWLTPAGRQRLWLLVIVRLVLPVLPASALSAWNVLNFATARTQFQSRQNSTASEMTLEVQPAAREQAGPSSAELPGDAAPHPQFRWQLMLTVGWALPATLLLLRLWNVNHSLAARLRRGKLVEDPKILELMTSCAASAGLLRMPTILITDAVATPAVHGILHPKILLPAGLFESLSPIEQRHVLLHELAHFRHRDVLQNWVLAELAIVHWFNPLLRLAISRMKADRELTRDAWVVEIERRDHGSDAAPYANTLINLAQRLSQSSQMQPQSRRRGRAGFAPAEILPALIGRPSGLHRRIRMIATNPHRGSSALSVIPLLALGATLLTGPVHTTAVAAIDPPASNPAAAPLGQADAEPHPNDALKAALDKVISDFDIEDEPLVDAFKLCEKLSGAKIEVDWPSLATLNVTPQSRFDSRIHNVRFRHLLDLMLESQPGLRGNADFVADEDTITISTIPHLKNYVTTRVYDIRDLLEPMVADRSHPAPSRAALLASVLKLIRNNVATESWKENGGTIATMYEADGQLFVTQRPENHRFLASLLTAVRAARERHIAVQAQCFTCDSELLASQLSKWWATLNAAPPGRKQIEAGVVISDETLKRVLDTFHKDGNFAPLAKPKFKLTDGQQAQLRTSQSQTYISDYAVLRDNAGKVTYRPITAQVEPGLLLETTARISDSDTIDLTIHAKATDLVSMIAKPWPDRPVGSDLSIRTPSVRIAEAQGNAKISKGQSLLITAPQSHGDRSLLILLTPTLDYSLDR